ncbi:MAG TPA: hypothetical protein VK777_10840 [Reyranella sp.]|nr:hypothetical protein [Reyranella sp.]
MKLIRRLARLRIAGQHAGHSGHAQSGAGAIVAMKDNEQTLAQRIKELEGAARKARLEAMQIAASLLMKENALLAEPRGNSTDKGDIAALRARYTGLVKLAEDTQAIIDKLHAEEHATKYDR